MSEKMLAASDFVITRPKITSQSRLVTWEGSLDGSPQILVDKPDKHIETEVAVRRFLAGKTGVLSPLEVARATNATKHIVANIMRKMARHGHLKIVHGKYIRYQVV